MTISASLKSSFPHPSFQYKHLLSYPEYYIGTLLFLIIIVIRRNKVIDGYRSNIIIGVSSLTLLASIFLFGRWAFFSHYYTLTLLPIFIVSAIIVDNIFNKIKTVMSPKVVYIITIFLMIIFSIYSQYIVHRDTLKLFWRESYRAGVWASENTEENAIFAMKDCGAFGYFSEKRTINLDGVVNNFVYQEYLREGELIEYLNFVDVDYIAQHAVPLNKKDYDIYEQIYPCRLYG